MSIRASGLADEHLSRPDRALYRALGQASHVLALLLGALTISQWLRLLLRHFGQALLAFASGTLAGAAKLC